LPEQFIHLMLHGILLPVVREACRQALDDTKPRIQLAQQQRSPFGGKVAAVKRRHYIAPAHALEFHLNLCTLCSQRAAPYGLLSVYCITT
jgi:hypothetical protein